VEISHHSLLRWRERFAEYGDEKADVLLEKIKKGFQLQGEPKPGYTFYNVDNISLLVHTNKYKSEIVTVINNAPVKPIENKSNPNSYSKWYKEQKRIKEQEEKNKENLNKILETYDSKDDEEILNSFPTTESKRVWLKAELKALDGLPEKKSKLNRRLWLEKKLGETRPTGIIRIRPKTFEEAVKLEVEKRQQKN